MNETAEQGTDVWLVTACDANYVSGAVVALSSACDTLPANRHAHLRVLGTDLSPRDRAIIASGVSGHPVVASFEILPVESLTGHLPEMEHFSTATYASLLVAELLPAAERVVFIDADTLTVQDIGRLSDVALHGFPIGAVADTTIAAHEGKPGYEPVFNAGVLLIDAHRWRQEGIGPALLRYCETEANIRFVEQDAINTVLRGRILTLDGAWNYQLGPETELLRSGATRTTAVSIVHFVGRKPWAGGALDSHPNSWRWQLAWMLALWRNALYRRRPAFLGWLAVWLAAQARHYAVAVGRRLLRRRWSS